MSKFIAANQPLANETNTPPNLVTQFKMGENAAVQTPLPAAFRQAGGCR